MALKKVSVKKELLDFKQWTGKEKVTRLPKGWCVSSRCLEMYGREML
jgi:hypothetical protein